MQVRKVCSIQFVTFEQGQKEKPQKKKKHKVCTLKEASSSLKQKGNRSARVCTAAPYLSLILAPDFTAGMQL